MIKNMLQAASKMLKDSKDEKVVCAKIIIDEIVGSMEPKDDWPMIPVPMVTVADEEKPKLKKSDPPKPKEGQYKVAVDRNRNLLEIEGLPLDADLEIDGKVVKHKDAIGKPFNSGKIL